MPSPGCLVALSLSDLSQSRGGGERAGGCVCSLQPPQPLSLGRGAWDQAWGGCVCSLQPHSPRS